MIKRFFVLLLMFSMLGCGDEVVVSRQVWEIISPSEGVVTAPPSEVWEGIRHNRKYIPREEGFEAEQQAFYTKYIDADGIAILAQQIAFTTTELTAGPTAAVELYVMDVNGRFAYETYPIGRTDVAHVDVNSDGIVDVEDLVWVAARFGSTAVRGAHRNADVNTDGVVNREDILLVIEALESQEHTTAAPSLTASNLQRWILEAKRRAPGHETFQRGIAMLEQLRTPFYPTETVLLANYPNPFNPETWIPYELATDTDVRLTIYNAQGVVVRMLQLGQQPAGDYTDRERAAYWDGRNAFGEPVASGLYFYTLTTGDFTATRKMLIKK